jgi:hypothetical protein
MTSYSLQRSTTKPHIPRGGSKRVVRLEAWRG